jgi:hypothetical protein
MKSKTIQVFNWKDIKSDICREMGIEEKYFRDYHKLIGGDYKDLWHEWMNYFNSEFTNDTIKNVELGERLDCKIEWITEDGKEWLEPFVTAVYKIWDDNDIEYVQYFW